MLLILIRHGDADPGNNDDTRTLSDLGRMQAVHIGNWLRKRGFPISPMIWHSNKVRTRETAAIIRDAAGWESELREVEGLRPSSSVEPIVSRISAEDGDLVIVTHLPFVSILAARLADNGSNVNEWSFPTCGTLVLERGESDTWNALDFVAPGTVE